MSMINPPPSTTVDIQDASGRLVGMGEPWRNWFNQVFTICNAAAMSGTTAQRPVTMLYVGRTYFDIDLGIPIWLLSGGPVVVWVDASGGVV